MGSSVSVKVDSRTWGRLAPPGRNIPSAVGPPLVAERDEAAAMNWGNPTERVNAVLLSCFLSWRHK